MEALILGVADMLGGHGSDGRAGNAGHSWMAPKEKFTSASSESTYVVRLDAPLSPSVAIHCFPCPGTIGELFIAVDGGTVTRWNDCGKGTARCSIVQPVNDLPNTPLVLLLRRYL